MDRTTDGESLAGGAPGCSSLDAPFNLNWYGLTWSKVAIIMPAPDQQSVSLEPVFLVESWNRPGHNVLADWTGS